MTVTTEHFYSGNNSTTSFAYTFPYYKTSDIKVKVGGTLKTESNHYNITGTNVVFTSGNVPPNGTNNIHIYRETDVDTSKATFAAGSSIRATDLNNNETQLLYHAQEQNFNKIQTADVEDKAITSDKILDGTIATADIADNAVTAAKLATNSIDATNLAANSVGASEIADNAVDTAAIADDAVTSAKIATGAVIADGLASNAVTTAKIYNEAVETAKIDDGAVTTAKINNAAVTADKLGTDSVITAKILDANVTTNKIANDSVTADKLANSINAEIAANTAKSSNATHTGEVTGATSLTITNSAVVTDRIADDAVTAAKLANSINAEIAANTAKTSNVTHTGEVTGSGALTIANDAVTTAKIADNAVTTAKIADAELTTLAGMQSGTASILADSTALTSTTAELNLLDGKSVVTAVSGSSTDVQLPTAKAVNDQIVNLLNEAGGFVPIANEVSFPNANPDPNDGAGTIVSIADAGGVVVNGSGVSTTGRTLGGATVTINGIDSSLNSSTIAAGKGMLVQTTSTLNTYTYHRLVVDEAGVATAQSLVSDFNERYRTGSSNPTSSLDDGDLFFNTSSNKMLVYNASDSSWDDVQSVGNYFINTISSYSGTGGNSATFNGTAYRFVLSNAGTYAQQHLVSVNGVIQKPNSGTSQPSEGFAIDGSSIIFSAAPATGADYFIITIGAAVNIGTPGNNTVSTVTLQNLAVTTDKIAADAVNGTKIADDAVGAEHIEVLDAALQFGDSVKAQWGTGNDLEIYHDGSSVGYIKNTTGLLKILSDGQVSIADAGNNEDLAKFIDNGAVELYYDNVKRFETYDSGCKVVGNFFADAIYLQDSEKINLGNADDLQIYHDGTNNYLKCAVDNQDITIASSKDLYLKTGDGSTGTHTVLYAADNAGVELRYDNSKKFETNSAGVDVTGVMQCDEFKLLDGEHAKFGTGEDLRIYHDGSNSYIKDIGTGNLYIYSANLRIENADGSESYIEANANGNVELFYDNSKKFETNSSGVTISGNATFGDGIGTVMGASNDFQIYHDNGNGSNTIDGLNHKIELLHSGEKMIVCNPDNSVKLYYDNSEKLRTVTGGIQVYGQTASNNGFYLNNGSNIVLEDNGEAQFGNSADLKITHDGTDSTILNNTGNLLLYSANDFYIKHGTEVMLAAKGDSGVELYYDNSKKLATGSGGIVVSGSYYTNDGNSIYLGSDNDLRLYHDGSNSYIDHSGAGDLYIRTLGSQELIRLNAAKDIELRVASGGEHAANFKASGSVELYYDNAQKLITASTGICIGRTNNSIATNSFGIALNDNGNISCARDGGSNDSQFSCWGNAGGLAVYGDGNCYNTNNSYGQISDETLKQDIVDAGSQWNDIKNIKVRKFKFKDNTSGPLQIGVVAQEIETVSPGLVSEIIPDENKPTEKVKTVKYSVLYMKAIKALQEAIAKIETLETKVAALEAK